MDTKPTISKSLRLPRQNKGGMPLMLSRAITNLVLGCCESFLNLKVVVQFTDGANVLSTKEAEVKQTELSTVITLPMLQQSGGGGSGLTRWFKGEGAPSSSTLSSDFYYISIPSSTTPGGPDHYYDNTDPSDPDLWVCITAGTNETSVWFNLSGCP